MFETSKNGGLSHISMFLFPGLCFITHKWGGLLIMLWMLSQKQKSVEMFTYYS